MKMLYQSKWCAGCCLRTGSSSQMSPLARRRSLSGNRMEEESDEISSDKSAQVAVHVVWAGEGSLAVDPRHHHLPPEDVQGQPGQERVQVVTISSLLWWNFDIYDNFQLPGGWWRQGWSGQSTGSTKWERESSSPRLNSPTNHLWHHISSVAGTWTPCRRRSKTVAPWRYEHASCHPHYNHHHNLNHHYAYKPSSSAWHCRTMAPPWPSPRPHERCKRRAQSLKQCSGPSSASSSTTPSSTSTSNSHYTNIRNTMIVKTIFVIIE